MHEPDAAELLTTGEVMRLFHIARSTVTLWRKEGKLRGYKPANMKQWRWPSNQPAIEEARAALRGGA
jgi:predicted site-specific integrase-resolvase